MAVILDEIAYKVFDRQSTSSSVLHVENTNHEMLVIS